MKTHRPLWLAMLLGLMLAGCGSKAEKDFMAGCTNSGAAKSVCSCIYGELKSDIATGEDEPSYLQSPVFKTRRDEAMQACRAK